MNIDHIRKMKHSQVSAEWYTPPRYVEAARAVMNGIELDPASSVVANRFVHADRYFTKEEDGRLQRWEAHSVWLNPPGSQRNGESAQEQWFTYLELAYKSGDTKQAVFCMYNVSGTETRWFQHVLGNYPVCFVNHRIRFVPEAGRYPQGSKNQQPVHGNAFIYLGPNNKLFANVFGLFGKVAPAWLKETRDQK